MPPLFPAYMLRFISEAKHKGRGATMEQVFSKIVHSGLCCCGNRPTMDTKKIFQRKVARTWHANLLSFLFKFIFKAIVTQIPFLTIFLKKTFCQNPNQFKPSTSSDSVSLPSRLGPNDLEKIISSILSTKKNLTCPYSSHYPRERKKRGGKIAISPPILTVFMPPPSPLL